MANPFFITSYIIADPIVNPLPIGPPLNFVVQLRGIPYAVPVGHLKGTFLDVNAAKSGNDMPPSNINQLWQPEPGPVIGPNSSVQTFYLQNPNSTLYMNVAGAAPHPPSSSGSGTWVDVWHLKNTPSIDLNQLWVIVPAHYVNLGGGGNDYEYLWYYICNAQSYQNPENGYVGTTSGLVLDIAEGGHGQSSVRPGSQVDVSTQKTVTTGPTKGEPLPPSSFGPSGSNQLWTFVDSVTGEFADPAKWGA